MDDSIDKALSHYGISSEEVFSLKELPSGINFVYLVETTRGKFVLKNYKKVKPPYLLDLHKYLVNLIEEGAPIPKIFPNKDGKYLTRVGNLYFDLSEFIEHIDLSDQVTISKEDLVLVGDTLVKLQRILNRKEVAHVLKKVDFEEKTELTLEAIEDFLRDFKKIQNDAKDNSEKHRLMTLKDIILETNPYRRRGSDEFSRFFSQPYVPAHGDYSMVNVLIKPDRSRVYVIDWDGFSLRPLVWDLQAALSLFSLTKLGNAYFIQPSFNKMKLFLDGYLKGSSITKEQILLLPEVAKYNFAIYWLSYTLPAILKGDYRLLSLIPDNKSDALYWLKGFGEYEEFVRGII